MKPGQGEPCPPSIRVLIRGHQSAALQHACPHCSVNAGQQCRGAKGKRLHQPHASRFEAAGLRTELDVGDAV